MINNPETLSKHKGTKFYTQIAMLFVALIVVVNIVVQKIIYLHGGLLLTAADVFYPLIYILGVILTEVYGYGMSRRVIWWAFFCNFLIAIIIMFAIALPPNPDWHDQIIFTHILGQTPRFVFASLCAFLIGEFCGAYMIAKMKVASGGKRLWFRATSATLLAQAIDCSIFVSLAFHGILSFKHILIMIATVYWSKIIYQVIATPAICLITKWLKKQEGIDIFDKKTNFNPLVFWES